MNAIKHKKELGAGFYTVPDISALLGFSQSKVRRYLDLYWDEQAGQALFGDTYSWSVNGRHKAVNFYVLIELYTFISLHDLGFSIHKILNIRNNIREEVKTQYPFASQKVLTDGKRIWYEHNDAIIKADGSRQIAITKIITDFAKKIDFQKNTALAERFWPKGRKSSIVVDPHHYFGSPVIDGTNIGADTIRSLHDSGESIKHIKFLYDLSDKQVKDAIAFYKKAA